MPFLLVICSGCQTDAGAIALICGAENYESALSGLSNERAYARFSEMGITLQTVQTGHALVAERLKDWAAKSGLEECVYANRLLRLQPEVFPAGKVRACAMQGDSRDDGCRALFEVTPQPSLELRPLLELKIASGMTTTPRGVQDRADAIQLIRHNQLPEDYPVDLVLAEVYRELWRSAQTSDPE